MRNSYVNMLREYSKFAFTSYLSFTHQYILDNTELIKTNASKHNEYKIESKKGLIALLVYSSVSLFSAVILPYLVTFRRLFTMRRLWMASQAIFAVSTLGTFIIQSSTGTIVLFGIVGFSWAVTAWVPYALLGAETTYSALPQAIQLEDLDDDQEDVYKYYDDDEEFNEGRLCNDAGLVYGIHNLSICLPQILITTGMGLERIIAGEKAKHHTDPDSNLVIVFRLAGMFALIAMYIARGVRDPR